MNVTYYSSNSAIAREDGTVEQELQTTYRYYTLTIKASYKEFKGSFVFLWSALLNYLKLVNYNSFKYVIEDENTDNIHIHALIECPFIKDKSIISKKLFGWSTRADIIRFNKEADIIAVWNLYINKQFSDSDKFERTYGNCFD